MVCATSLLCLASLAHADEGWYVSGQAGASILTSSEIGEPTGVLDAIGTEIDFDVGYGLSGAVGYHWGLFRVEGEINYAESDINEFEIVGIGVSGSGDANSLGFMANAFKDFEISDGWQFYLGGGIGYAIVSINDASILDIPLADDLALFVDTENQGTIRRRQIQTDDVADLLHEEGIARQLEGLR